MQLMHSQVHNIINTWFWCKKLLYVLTGNYFNYDLKIQRGEFQKTRRILARSPQISVMDRIMIWLATVQYDSIYEVAISFITKTAIVENGTQGSYFNI